MDEQEMDHATFQGSLDDLQAICGLLNVTGQGAPDYAMQRKKSPDTNTAQVFFYPFDDDGRKWLGRITVRVMKPSGPLRLKVLARPREWDALKPVWGRLKTEIDRYNAQGPAMIVTSPISEATIKMPKINSAPWNKWRTIWNKVRPFESKKTIPQLYSQLSTQQNDDDWLPSPETLRRIVLAGRAQLLESRRIT